MVDLRSQMCYVRPKKSPEHLDEGTSCSGHMC